MGAARGASAAAGRVWGALVRRKVPLQAQKVRYIIYTQSCTFSLCHLKSRPVIFLNPLLSQGYGWRSFSYSLLFCFFTASPTQALSAHELQQITDDISKLAIAHEIVLNGDFKLQAASFSPKRCVCIYIYSGLASFCHITENL